MRSRKKQLGTRNIIGEHVEMARRSQGIRQKALLDKLHDSGVDITGASLSKLEGQVRGALDYELLALADALNVSVNWLLGREK